jgi:hypothetical protein
MVANAMTASNGTRASGQEPSGEYRNHRITARTVRTADGTIATEYVVDGAVVATAAEVKALLAGGSA